MANKKQIQGGLSGLLNPTQATAPTVAPTPTAETSTPQEPVQVRGTMKSGRGTTTRVCYNLNADLVAKVRQIAAYDRKNINEVYNDALAAYIEQWTPTAQEPPKF